jgi:putative nucleotidyltransferase with HDIG domain
MPGARSRARGPGRCLGPMRVLRPAPIYALTLLVATVATAVATSRSDDWRLPVVLVLLTVLAVIADRFQIRTPSGTYVAGTMPVFVLAAVLFGPAPAAAIGAAVALTQRRKAFELILGDVASMATFPLLAALATRAVAPLVEAHPSVWFLLLVVGAFMVAWTTNVVIILIFMGLLRGRPIVSSILSMCRQMFAAQLAHAFATAGLVFAYLKLGPGVIVFAGLVMVTYSRLQGDLIEAERLRDEAQERNAELAATNERLRRAHFGAMRSLVRSIHLHDRMTARHSAAVARYARAIARAAGCSEADQQLVHTAGLLHDVGKHILDDAILKGDSKLDDDQWELVKRHPEEGARIVRLLEGQEAVAEIIHAHHERIDGRGYPRGLAGEGIPRLSRMISIADTYDVMTARDSYRDPVSSAAAVEELRRVSGAQLDGELVEIFVREVLGHGGAAFAHGDDADFEAELASGRDGVGAPDGAPVADAHGAGDAEPQLSPA